MNKLSFIFCVLLLFSCGSKKNFSRIDSTENINSVEQLRAELYRDTRLLEFLDIKYRQIETRDSAGNVRIETDVDFSKKTEENTQDSTNITAARQENTEKVVDHDEGEERSGVMEYWVWIVGFIAIIVVALVVGICLIKK
nr:MAG TPA: TYPE IV PILUS BIOGENESIS AND TRANSPORT, OUTER MEMBRANE PROTEIN.0A [Caudoviricetes sp.]